MSRHSLMTVAVLLLAVSPSSAAEKRTQTFDAHRFLLDHKVVIDPKDGCLRLAHSVLVADEMGATDFHQTETLSDRVWAMKIFPLQKEEVREPELFIFGSAQQIEVNDRPVPRSERLASTGWTRARVPEEFFRDGLNRVVMKGGGQLLIEPAANNRRDGTRSLRSTDRGLNFVPALGKNQVPGEYLVRLRLARYAPTGSALSEVFDLWADPASGIATPGACLCFHPLDRLRQGLPEGTSIIPRIRTGSTPTPDADHWTPWVTLLKDGGDYRPEGKAARHRWAQLQIEFLTNKPQATPRLPRRFDLTFEFQPEVSTNSGQLEIAVPAAERPIAVSPIPFVYQEPSPRLKLLRERYQLDEVIAPGRTEMEQLMLLRHWVRHQWHTGWRGGPAAWMPPWDALIILESKDQPDCLTMCTHYAAVFTQCCLALGWNARHCILDHHCVSEVYVNQYQKWVMLDPGNSQKRADLGLHFERDGVPLSALELHRAYRTGQTDAIRVCFTPAALAEKIAPLCRPAPPSPQPSPPAGGEGKARETRPDSIPLAELPNYPVCQLQNYRRYAFPARNNYLSSLLPGELYQGWSPYFYDGYWWVGDSPDAPQISPEYSLHLSPDRPQDIDWSLNWTRIHLSRTAQPGEVQVDLETHTPNLARLERSEGDSWKPTPASFTWKLKPGENVLRVRSVNKWDRPGAEARVQVKWAP
ncbi:MAG TPA: hypothetical protein VNK04_14620 [Gemmataceae bacterium]|nr:hypothetical protein [Gemmataceae bacterium]